MAKLIGNIKRKRRVLYVGETGNNFRTRLQKHVYSPFFMLFATKVKLIKFEPDEDDKRILYEKVKILVLNPLLNKPRTLEKDKELDNFRSEVVTNDYLQTRLMQGWGTYEEILELIDEIQKGGDLEV